MSEIQKLEANQTLENNVTYKNPWELLVSTTREAKEIRKFRNVLCTQSHPKVVPSDEVVGNAIKVCVL